jgi:glycosyltransferase involved in cell wall biosynthesis
VYNNPTEPGEYDGVQYLPQGDFKPAGHRDVFIVFRSPNPHVTTAKAGYKIHWSTDQYTVGNFASDIFPHVDKVVCISPFHVQYHKQRYGIEADKIGYIDLGVRLEDYDLEVKKIEGRCIFCSIPDRGLEVLFQIWPKVRARVPEASLVITSDYRLWGVSYAGNEQHRLAWLSQEGVVFLGMIPRHRLVKEQLAAQVHIYPCTYEELFCISAAECQVAGALPVTTGVGALATTNEWGRILPGPILGPAQQEAFADAVVEMMNIDSGKRHIAQEKACIRFDWDDICGQWERLIETGVYHPAVERT